MNFDAGAVTQGAGIYGYSYRAGIPAPVPGSVFFAESYTRRDDHCRCSVTGRFIHY